MNARGGGCVSWMGQGEFSLDADEFVIHHVVVIGDPQTFRCLPGSLDKVEPRLGLRGRQSFSVGCPAALKDSTPAKANSPNSGANSARNSAYVDKCAKPMGGACSGSRLPSRRYCSWKAWRSQTTCGKNREKSRR